MPRISQTIRKYATNIVEHENGSVSVRLHKTIVASKNVRGAITLNSGGWRTPTTKRRINECLSEWGSPWRVVQRDFAWYIVARFPDAEGVEISREFEFKDGVKILATPELTPLYS